MSAAAASTSGARPQKNPVSRRIRVFFFRGKGRGGIGLQKLGYKGERALGFLGVEEVQCNNLPLPKKRRRRVQTGISGGSAHRKFPYFFVANGRVI